MRNWIPLTKSSTMFSSQPRKTCSVFPKSYYIYLGNAEDTVYLYYISGSCRDSSHACARNSHMHTQQEVYYVERHVSTDVLRHQDNRLFSSQVQTDELDRKHIVTAQLPCASNTGFISVGTGGPFLLVILVTLSPDLSPPLTRPYKDTISLRVFIV